MRALLEQAINRLSISFVEESEVGGGLMIVDVCLIMV